MKKRCRAENPECGLDTGTSLFNGSLKCIKCDVCCEEPGFCRECRCILCGKVMKTFPKNNIILRCHQRISEAGVCGHAAHMDCALDAKLAGVVKHHNGSGIGMEYLCRRCDKNTDLKGVVSNMLAEWDGTMRSDSWVMRGTLLDRNATDGSEMLAQKALEMIQDGEDIREVLRKLADSINSEGGDKDLNLEEASLDQWLPSLSSTSTQMSALQLPIDIQSTPITGITSLATSLKIFDMIGTSDSRAHIPLALARDEIKETYTLTNTTEMEAIQGQVGHEDLALVKQILEKSNDGTVAVSRISEEDRSLKTSQNLGNQIETGYHMCDDGQASLGVEVIKHGQALSEPTTSSSSLGKLSAETLDDTTSQAVAQNSSKDPDTAPSAAGARLHTPDELDLQYERDIKDALKKLKERQIREFISRKDGLLSLKNDMLNQHQELELARRDLLTQAPTMSLGSVNALIKKISALSAVLERQRISFDSILWSCKGKCPGAEDTA